jgi:hypothetical protein
MMDQRGGETTFSPQRVATLVPLTLRSLLNIIRNLFKRNFKTPPLGKASTRKTPNSFKIVHMDYSLSAAVLVGLHLNEEAACEKPAGNEGAVARNEGHTLGCGSCSHDGGNVCIIVHLQTGCSSV